MTEQSYGAAEFLMAPPRFRGGHKIARKKPRPEQNQQVNGCSFSFHPAFLTVLMTLYRVVRRKKLGTGPEHAWGLVR